MVREDNQQSPPIIKMSCGTMAVASQFAKGYVGNLRTPARCSTYNRLFSLSVVTGETWDTTIISHAQASHTAAPLYGIRSAPLSRRGRCAPASPLPASFYQRKSKVAVLQSNSLEMPVRKNVQGQRRGIGSPGHSAAAVDIPGITWRRARRATAAFAGRWPWSC